jgi:flagellar basal body-associated protein FliL
MLLIALVAVVLIVGLSFIVWFAAKKDREAEEQLTSEQIPEEPIVAPKQKKHRAKKTNSKPTKKVK